MLSEYYFVIQVLFGLASLVFVLFLISYDRPSNSIPGHDKQNVAARIVPFIEAHQSRPTEPEQQDNAIAKEALKWKIEGCKIRERFYQL